MPSRATVPAPAPLPPALCRMLSGLSAAAVRSLDPREHRHGGLPGPTAAGLGALLPELSEAPAGRLDYRVPLIAPMKAGKSTLLNALVCRELLPSRGPAMTVLPTGVVPVDHRTLPAPVLTLPPVTAAGLATLAALLEDPGRHSALRAAVERHPQLATVARAPAAAAAPDRPTRCVGTGRVREALARLNDLLRLALLALPEDVAPERVLRLRPPEVTVPVPWLASPPEGGRLVLVDTPGPDEDLLPGVLNSFVAEEVRRAHEVLVIRDATRRGSTAESQVERLLAQDTRKGGVPSFTVLNRADLVRMDEPAPEPVDRIAAGAGQPRTGGRTAARQGLAAAAVLWSEADADTSGAVEELLRGAFPLDWEDRTGAPASVTRALAERTWERSGVPSVVSRFVRDRAGAPGAWALAHLLGRLAPVTDAPSPGTAAGPPPPAAPRKALDDLAVLATRRQRVARAARAHFADLEIEWT
ncbi:P-loop NTPase family protein [Streptomyces erythrochromogenes]|uniref:hypothetical protein n=1 Tax=Streptomyces erythrochromogenes TaxID=285574 RepID=UPI0036A7D1D4